MFLYSSFLLAENKESNLHQAPYFSKQMRPPTITHYKWWLRVAVYIISLLSGQSTATLLGELYYDKGGNSKWMATFVQSAGFPILIPLFFFFLPTTSTTSQGRYAAWKSWFQHSSAHPSVESCACPCTPATSQGETAARQDRLQSNSAHPSDESCVYPCSSATTYHHPFATLPFFRPNIGR